ncbi:hypothetical protein ABK040_003141 [Willaertia magna]
MLKIPEEYKIKEFIHFPYENETFWHKVNNKLNWLKNKEEISTIDVLETIKEITGNDKMNLLILEKALNEFETIHYKKDYNTQDSFLKLVIPSICQFVLDTPTVLPPKSIKSLKKQKSNEIELTKLQIVTILSNSFFCTFYNRPSALDWSILNIPSINLDEMYTSQGNQQAQLAKCKMFLNYFTRMTNEMNLKTSLKIKRNVLQYDITNNIKESTKTLTNINVISEGSISDSKDALQIDFANKFIGGASISFGCVQEEIEFSICPELNVTRLFCEEMDNNESITIIGAEQFSKYKGYAFTLDYDGNFIDDNKDEDSGNFKKETCAIDALMIFKYQLEGQWKKASIDRELIKAYCGFSSTNLKKVATGNWGCGAFNGDKQLKAIIQYIAASEAEKDIDYYTFKTELLDNELPLLVKELKERGVTVGELYKGLLKVYDKIVSKPVMTFKILRQIFGLN